MKQVNSLFRSYISIFSAKYCLHNTGKLYDNFTDFTSLSGNLQLETSNSFRNCFEISIQSNATFLLCS